MIRSKHAAHGSNDGARAFLAPMAWIVTLLAGYWVLADWQTLPDLICNAIAAI